MDFFKKAKIVRMRSYHAKYLFAGKDECKVFQSREGSESNAKWQVEVTPDGKAVRFMSCYNSYLKATNMPFLLGVTGKKVLQIQPLNNKNNNDGLSLDSSVEWEPIKEGYTMKLKNRSCGSFLYGNGMLPPLRNSVTHDRPKRSLTHDWILWEVEMVEPLFTPLLKYNASVEHASLSAITERPGLGQDIR